VLNVVFGQPTIAVDTHNFRVANRTGIAPGKSVEQVERGLMKFVPPEFLLHAHHWLILHGRYVCKAQKPDCPNCNVSDLCEFRHKTPDPLAQPIPKLPHNGVAKAPAAKRAAARAVKPPAKRATKAAAKEVAKAALKHVAKAAIKRGGSTKARRKAA
jgi:adenine-specific DNA glycosylase